MITTLNKFLITQERGGRHFFSDTVQSVQFPAVSEAERPELVLGGGALIPAVGSSVGSRS